MRSVTSPGTRMSVPGTTFGRSVPPNRNGVVVWFCVMPIGNPLCIVTTVVTDQPPRNAPSLRIGVVVRRTGDDRVIVLQPGVARVVVALRELVVVQAAERVADLSAP